MSARKKWRLVWAPGSHYERVLSPGNFVETMPSRKRAYEVIEAERGCIETGLSTTASVTVQVDTGEGLGWQTHEHIELRPDGAR